MTTTIDAAVRVTAGHRRTARRAEQTGMRILAACNGLVEGHEIRVADPEDVPDGKPLVSLLLYRLNAEAHAFGLDTAVDELVRGLWAEAKSQRGDSRRRLIKIADRMATLG